MCLSAIRHSATYGLKDMLTLALANWFTMTLLHGTYCCWNDIVDADIDAHVERTKRRPLPSGRISRIGALFFFFGIATVTTAAIFSFLGREVLVTAIPIYIIATIYPFAKRIVHWPQFVLAPAVAWPAFVGWVSASAHGKNTVTDCLPLFFAYFTWTIYFDTCYGLQDAKHDRKINVGSLAVFLGDNIRPFLAFMGTILIALLGVTAWRAHASLVYWVFAIGVWAASIPWQLSVLDPEKENTGGKIFAFNISLGIYITAVSLAELYLQQKAF